jgi:hypothetical protein
MELWGEMKGNRACLFQGITKASLHILDHVAHVYEVGIESFNWKLSGVLCELCANFENSMVLYQCVMVREW